MNNINIINFGDIELEADRYKKTLIHKHFSKLVMKTKNNFTSSELKNKNSY